jgi:hypothetical protein
MKKILLAITFIATLASCNKDGYTITGKIAGVNNGKSVILQNQDEMGQLKSIDTVKVENGEFKFTGKATEPSIHLIQIDSIPGKVVFVLEEGDIEMTINKDSINNAKVIGTYNNDEFNNFKNEGMKIQKRMMKFQSDNMAKMTAAEQQKDTIAMAELRKEFSKFQDEYVSLTDNYAKTHPKSYISALIIESMFNQMIPDIEKITKYYTALDKSVQATKTGKSIKTKLDQYKKMPTNPSAPTAAPAPAPAPSEADSK